ncbi:hypothetical protein N9059_00225 [bacterium]|nr:hypothetical protein [bacterium]
MCTELSRKKNSSKDSKSLDQRFANRPNVYKRLQEIADVMDKAEEMAIEQVGKLGGEIIVDWAQCQSEESVRKTREVHPEAIKDV